MDDLAAFASKHNIPVTQTVMGYSTMKRDHSHFLETHKTEKSA